jgi:hypothetical protein
MVDIKWCKSLEEHEKITNINPSGIRTHDLLGADAMATKDISTI